MLRFTEEQLEAARLVSIVDYLHVTEPQNIYKSSPNEYKHKEYKGLVMSNGKWNWFNGDVGSKSGTALDYLDYLCKVKNIPFVQAVKEVLAHAGIHLLHTHEQRQTSKEDIRLHENTRQDYEKREFVPPAANEDNNKVVAYLADERKISRVVIEKCINNGSLYQSKGIPNCVFIGMDANGERKQGFIRGIKSNFRRDVLGSQKKYNFCIPPNSLSSPFSSASPNSPDSSNNSSDSLNSPDTSDSADSSAGSSTVTTVAIFESPIDAMAHNTIMDIIKEYRGQEWEWDGYRLSLGGTSLLAIKEFLSAHPEIQKIEVCLDNDVAGKAAERRLGDYIASTSSLRHIQIENKMPEPKHGKDYGEWVHKVVAWRDNHVAKQQAAKRAAENVREQKPTQATQGTTQTTHTAQEAQRNKDANER